mmetsp:Transcript_7654/g.12205  ORF Transcript_7654/g.12205 Transcript_7654/m.12205 type:complete len:377 (-) Transcript_7654:310-1440(-)
MTHSYVHWSTTNGTEISPQPKRCLLKIKRRSTCIILLSIAAILMGLLLLRNERSGREGERSWKESFLARTMQHPHHIPLLSSPLSSSSSPSSSSSSKVGVAATNDDDDDDAKFATKSTGMYGAKIQAVLSRMLRLRAKQPGVKVVVFSQWQEVLSLLADALQRHGLDYAMPKTSCRHGFHRAIQRFKRRGSDLEEAANTSTKKYTKKKEKEEEEEEKKKKEKKKETTTTKRMKKEKSEKHTGTYASGSLSASYPSPSFPSSPKVEVGCDALLLQLKSGGQGLNLTEATHVMFIDPSLNTAQHLQAAGRVHRIGQTKPTFVHWFVIKDSIEENIYALHRQHCHDARLGAASAKEKDVLSVDDVGKLLKAKSQRKIGM